VEKCVMKFNAAKRRSSLAQERSGGTKGKSRKGCQAGLTEKSYTSGGVKRAIGVGVQKFEKNQSKYIVTRGVTKAEKALMARHSGNRGKIAKKLVRGGDDGGKIAPAIHHTFFDPSQG